MPASGGKSLKGPRARVTLATILVATACLPARTGPMPAGTDPRALPRAIDALLDAPATRSARWGVLVVDPEGRDTLYARDAHKLFVPASNMKIITAAIALETLGAEYRFRTPVVATGPIRDGVLYGDLVVTGQGDPSISDHVAGHAMIPLEAAAAAVASHGIQRVAGSIRSGGDAFPDANLGFGWAWDDLDYAYSAAVDELLFNEGFSTVHVRGGDTPATSPAVWTAPARTFPPLRADVRTVALDTADTMAVSPSIEIVKDSVKGDVVVRGTIASGDSTTYVVTHRDPARAFLAAFREALREHGVTVADSLLETDSLHADTVAVIESPPLSDILGFFMKPSQNQVGEMLFKSIALHRADTGTTRVARRVYREQLEAWGVDTLSFAIFDGSGLSRRDMLAPATIVHVLERMRRSPWFAAFHDALPVAGVDGTLRTRMRGTRAEANVRAKTGTLGSVRSLSGYVTTADGHPLIFSILANNFLVSSAEIGRVQDSIAVHLARLRVADRGVAR